MRLTLLQTCLCFILPLLPFHSLLTQSLPFDCGVELQAYSTGLLPGVRLEQALPGRHSIHIRLGANLLDHRDLGVQNDERGRGLGGTLGYRRFFQPDWKGWLLGIRTDLWFNRVDWQELDTEGRPLRRGTTELLVVQPTLEGGYQFTFANGRWYCTPTLGFGVEINAVTRGAATGQGAILLLGINLGRRFSFAS